jgi:GT2 family glycosyltransferase
VTTVTPVHGGLAYTRACLESIRRNTRPAHRILVVDNASPDGSGPLLAAEPGVEVVQLDRNVGFGGACNLGLARASGDVLVLNNDTVVTPGWLERLAAQATGRVGLVGATANYVVEHQLVREVPYGPDLQGLDEFAAGIARRHAGQTVTSYWLSGMGLHVRRAVIELIGGFDPAFGLGSFEDIDYSLHAWAAGRECVVAQDVYIHHHGNRIFGALKVDWYRQMDANFTHFKQKWGLPNELERTEDFDFGRILARGASPARDFVPLPEAKLGLR